MTVRAKLVAIIVLVVLAPLGTSAWMALRVHQRAFDEQLDSLQESSAEQGAHVVQATLDSATRSFTHLASQVRWAELTPAELDGALWLLYRGDNDVSLVTASDATGRLVGSAYGEPEHPKASVTLRSRFLDELPSRTALASGKVAMGHALLGLAGRAVLPIAIPVASGRGSELWVVGVGLSMRSACADLATLAGAGREILVVDDRGRLLCRPSGQVLTPVDPALPRIASGAVSYVDADGRELRAAMVTLPSRWTVVVQQPTVAAFASSRRMRAQSLLWIALGLVGALAAGLALARTITRPVEALVHGANELARGNLAHRLDDHGQDELGRLAHAFNAMTLEIERRDGEIRGWNDELQQRVEAGTRELRDAQDQLLRSQKMAAVASLGAGFAHEINNPLTSVIGFAQLLLSRFRSRTDLAREVELLGTIESESLRIKRIIGTLQALAADYTGEGFAELDANRLLDDALRPFAAQLDAEKVEVVRDYTPSLPAVLGSAGELSQALSQLFKNALAAMHTGGGKLRLSTAVVDGKAVRVSIADTGIGIAREHLEKIFDPFFTTKDNWRSEGLGLTVAHRVITQHHGRIDAASELGLGTTITITLPAGKRVAHLQ